MKVKNYILFCFFIAISSMLKAQEAVLCPLQTDVFKIENTENIPEVNPNEDGTVSLIFSDESVTDVFANYTIYEFYQMFPNSSAILQRYYSLTFDTKNLIESLIANVPETVITWAGSEASVYNSPIRTPVNSEFIQALDGNSYDVTQFKSTSDADPCQNNPCTLFDVPADFNFRVIFNYDEETELLNMESDGTTPCGNEFSIALAGGNPNEFNGNTNYLQLWESLPFTSALSENTQACHNIEATIFALLDIACPPHNSAIGDIRVILDSENETLRFYRENLIFGEHIIELSRSNLSIADQTFSLMRPFELENNPYLHISNRNNQPISVDIYGFTGQQIMQTKTFEENSLNISNLSSGLYFIRLSNLNNQQNVFKFLKN